MKRFEDLQASPCATFNFWYGGENSDGESSKDGHSGFTEEDEVWFSGGVWVSEEANILEEEGLEEEGRCFTVGK